MFKSATVVKNCRAELHFMDVQIQETEKGYEIDVYTDKKIAVVVKGDEERIYLPESSKNNSTYYTENYKGLNPTEFGYKLIHRGQLTEYEVLG